MKTEIELKRNVQAVVSFYEVDPALPAAMKMSVISNITPESQQSAVPNSSSDDDSSWFNESPI